MCMTDDDPTSSTCFDTESSTGESSAAIQGATVAATGGICPRCLTFWLIVAVIAFGAVFYFNRRK